jgi:hypothetical protein
MNLLYPIGCYDNFYKDPDPVREFALGLDYTKYGGFYPGFRSPCISTLNTKLFEYSVKKLLSMYGNYYDIPLENYEVFSYFQKIYRFSSDPDDVINDGWIHCDGNTLLAAVVYLDKEPFSNNGTSFYHKVNSSSKTIMSQIDGAAEQTPYDRIIGESDHCKIDDVHWYRDKLIENNNQFNLTVSVNNCYNRLISYSGDQWHGQSNYYMPNDQDFRLTQVFFFYRMNVPINLIPSIRCSADGI